MTGQPSAWRHATRLPHPLAWSMLWLALLLATPTVAGVLAPQVPVDPVTGVVGVDPPKLTASTGSAAATA